jgi:Fic family protein
MILDLHSRILELKAEWDRAQPLSSENEQRLWRKLRLEWNYNSNHIEGNTLTYGETELLIIQGKTTGQHELREYEEMKAHDVAIHHIRELAQEDRSITEGDIRGLNQIILKEPFWKEAITADGQPSRKQIIPGAYKTTPNNVKTATGEMFMFKSPEETPLAMAELTGWFREKLEDQSLNLPLFLATFHHRFSVIHPFDDGNGRTMRLLVNYALLKRGYLPIIIKSESKKEYLGVLGAADAGDVQPFVHLIQDRMIKALEMGLRASRGESIEEPEDWQKEMTLLVRDYGKEGSPAPPKSPQLLRELIDHSFFKLVERVLFKLKPLESVFFARGVKLIGYNVRGLGGEVTIKNDSDRDLIRRQEWGCHNDGASLEFTLYGFSNPDVEPFDVTAFINFSYSSYRYSIFSEALSSELKGLRYDKQLTESQIESISAAIAKLMFQKVKDNIEPVG